MKMPKGKMSRIFQELKEGESVAVVIDVSESADFPKRMQGRTGIIESKKGKAFHFGENDCNYRDW